jgi:hypothetical protein
MNGKIDVWMDLWWMHGWVDVNLDGFVNGRLDVWDVFMYGWMSDCMGRWIIVSMGEWVLYAWVDR